MAFGGLILGDFCSFKCTQENGLSFFTLSLTVSFLNQQNHCHYPLSPAFDMFGH